MAPFVLWTAVLAAFCSLGVSAMPMLTAEGLQQSSDRTGIPPAVLEWYLQQRDLQFRDDREDQPLQASELRQLKQWLDAQLARLPMAAAEQEEPSKQALVVPQQPKRGNYMALCHFKICNMGRKRSPRIQPQDLP